MELGRAGRERFVRDHFGPWKLLRDLIPLSEKQRILMTRVLLLAYRKQFGS